MTNHLRDYDIITCSCVEGPYYGAQMMGTPVRCERCGFITVEQMNALKAQAWQEAHDLFCDDSRCILFRDHRNPYEED